MSAAADKDAWVRLGEMLARRRVELDPRYHNRALFAEERGLDYRLSYDVESGARTNYRRSTLAAIEVAYGLERGAIDRALDGADLDGMYQPQAQDRPHFYDDPEFDAAVQEVWDKKSALTPEQRKGLIRMARELRRGADERRNPRSQRAAS